MSAPTLAIFRPSQLRVIELLALGWCILDVARILGVSEWTVRNHIKAAAARLPEDFYPDLCGRRHVCKRLLMFYAVATREQQLELGAA